MLSREQTESLEYGDLPGRPAFASDEERRAAWFHHRDELLRHCRGGKRPAGWWSYESPVPYPGRDYAPAALFEAKLLTASELAELMTRWRADFERAQAADFRLCLAPGRTLKGKAARKAHLKWAGVPRALIRKWTAEYRRRRRTVRELEETATGDPMPAA
jgi:hypothetical protein